MKTDEDSCLFGGVTLDMAQLGLTEIVDVYA